MYNGPERRRHPRLTIGFVVSHRVKDSGGTYELSLTQNISQGGMFITASRQYAPHSDLELMLRFPFVRERVKLTGKVLDSKEVAKNMIYATRIQFLDPEEEILRKLGSFIQSRLLASA